MRITIENVEKGKTDNWLVFHLYMPLVDVNKLFKFEFCGTDLDPIGATITDENLETFRTVLCNKFGYAPYDINKAKKILGTGLMLDLEESKWLA